MGEEVLSVLERLLSEVGEREVAVMHLRAHEELLASAEELYAKGERERACRAYWSAVVELLKAYGALKGRRGEPKSLAEELNREVGGASPAELLATASRLLAEPEALDACRAGLLELITRVREGVEGLRLSWEGRGR